MENLIQLNSFPIKCALKKLLQDKTTKKNIIWATDSYESYGEEFLNNHQMTESALLGLNQMVLQPRSFKDINEQQERTKTHAEVFTPAWVCNKMNNFCDSEWFGRNEVFNIEKEESWETKKNKVLFPSNKMWTEYIDSRRLEITCGEAPFLVSRYDSSTSEAIPIRDRIGILDRKLRIVNENTENEDDWLKWAIRAVQSIYGYEYQGDNLLIARINILITFDEYLKYKWERHMNTSEINKISNIIAWNIWQMDGLTDSVPLGIPEETSHQLSLFEFLSDDNDEGKEVQSSKCLIHDWRMNKSLLYESLKNGGE